MSDPLRPHVKRALTRATRRLYASGNLEGRNAVTRRPLVVPVLMRLKEN
jgi:hypothetical protein